MTEPNKELPKEVLFDLGAFGQRGAAKAWKYAQSHYATIIEAKDKQIERLKAEKAELREMVSEKYATISKLMGLLKKNFMGRQRLFFQSENINIKYPISDDMLQSQFEDYCKENGIDLGGE